MAYNMSGKIAIVTGASSGMGETFAIRFAKLGAKVALCGRNQQKLHKAVEKCKAASGGKADRFISIAGDVTKSDDRQQILKQTVAAFGKVDILVANAGLSMPADLSFSTMDEASWDKIMDTNLKSVFFLIKDSVVELEKSKGCIVCVSSLATRMAKTMAIAYSISKAGIDFMVKSLAMELAPKQIRINAIQPGHINTGLMDKIAEASGVDAATMEQMVASQEDQNHVLHGRCATQDEIANALLFLASNESAGYVNGLCMPVGGGREYLG